MAETLTAAEAAVYDRQLRVWGVETQHKLRSSNVLIIGCTGLAAEIAKNIVLAGIGSVTLVDDRPCSERPQGNFLVPHDCNPSQNVAEACVAILQEMNPLVKIDFIAASPASHASSVDNVADYQLVLLVGQSAHAVKEADNACSQANVPFMAACSGSLGGWGFANLHDYEYSTEKKEELEDGTVKKTVQNHTIRGTSWEKALLARGKIHNAKRMSPLLSILRVVGPFEMEKKDSATSKDIPELTEKLLDHFKLENISGGSPDVSALQSHVENIEEMPAISAILGGIVANDVIKIVARKGEPTINNVFLYSLFDGAGWVESLS